MDSPAVTLERLREAYKEYKQARDNASACPPDNECYQGCNMSLMDALHNVLKEVEKVCQCR